MKGKPPAFQFYVRDWLSDPQLRMASHDTKGVWIDLLCFMWEAPERGQLTGTPPELARMVGATDEVFGIFLDEAKRLKFADVTFCNNEVTLINRRMARDQKNRNNTRLRVARHRSNAPCNGKVTPPSSSSSSSSSFSKKKKSTPLPPKGESVYSQEFEIFWKAYPRKQGGKIKTFEVWKSAKKKNTWPGTETVMSGLNTLKNSPQWQRDGGKFIPHPQTFLNQGRWDDEIETQGPTGIRKQFNSFLEGALDVSGRKDVREGDDPAGGDILAADHDRPGQGPDTGGRILQKPKALPPPRPDKSGGPVD